MLVIGIPGLTWDDISRSRSSTLAGLAESWLIGNVSVRVSNGLGEGYATLGAGNRVQTEGSAGWAFNLDETVENGPASALFERRSGRTPHGAVGVVTISRIRDGSPARRFGAKTGLLGELLRQRGRKTAVVGNADLSSDVLPDSLPALSTMSIRRPPEVGIHREAALAAMDSRGVTALGDVSRKLLEANPQAPFGIAASPAAVEAAFSQAWAGADLVVVETGDTFRADSYSQGLSDPEARAIRLRALKLADRQISSLLKAVDHESTLVVILSPTTPGGPGARGQLRPVLIHVPASESGLLTSASTRRPGLVSITDLTATIARHLDLSGERFEGGRAVQRANDEGGVQTLVNMNSRAVIHDRLRGPITGVIVALQLVIYAIVILKMMKAPLPKWMLFVLVSSIAFPLATFASRTPVWEVGVIASVAAILLVTVALGGLATWASRKVRLGGPMLILSAISAFLVVDQLVGAPAQLDSVYGYTSVAAGRFYGLGNLGFALLAGSVLLLAGMVTDRWGAGGRWTAAAIILVAAITVGHPGLGDDVGGILTMVAAGATFGFRAWKGGKIPRRLLPAVGILGIVTVAAFGAIDLARPASERTHMGDFLESLVQDPLSVWLLIKRKGELAFALAVQNYWGVVAVAAIAVLVFLHRRSGLSWGAVVKDHPGMRAGLDSLLVAAIAGSILNDSGVAVAGMMLAIAAPWALLVTADLARKDPTQNAAG